MAHAGGVGHLYSCRVLHGFEMNGMPKRLLLPLVSIDTKTGRIARWVPKGPGLWGVKETHAAQMDDKHHVGQVPLQWYETYRRSGAI